MIFTSLHFFRFPISLSCFNITICLLKQILMRVFFFNQFQGSSQRMSKEEKRVHQMPRKQSCCARKSKQGPDRRTQIVEGTVLPKEWLILSRWWHMTNVYSRFESAQNNLTSKRYSWPYLFWFEFDLCQIEVTDVHQTMWDRVWSFYWSIVKMDTSYVFWLMSFGRSLPYKEYSIFFMWQRRV